MSSTRPSLLDQEAPNQIRTVPCPTCYLCGERGELLYENLRDRLYSAPGVWTLKRCSDWRCGLIWLDPMPCEEDIGKAYRDYFTHCEANFPRSGLVKRAKEFLKSGYWAGKYGYRRESTARWQRFLGAIVRLHPRLSAELDVRVMYVSFRENGRLLDVGCGSGLALEGMAELGWQVYGVDFDPKAVEIAQRKGLEVNLGSLKEQAYPPDYFDVVTMSHLIEHVHDPLGLLRECRRILKPQGLLTMVTPNSDSWGHKRFAASWMHLDPPRHLHVFNEQSLTTLLGAAGFRVVRLRSTIRDADGVFIRSRSIQSTGRHRMDWSRHSLTRRLWGRGMQLYEWALLKQERRLGEEIALVAARESAVI